MTKAFACVCAALLVCGCQAAKELPGRMDRRQAIEAVVTLGHAHISAELERTSAGKEEQYTVQVPSRDYLRALELMNQAGLPRPAERDIELLTRPQGFAPASPELADLRLDLTLEWRLERLLNALPGVVDARVLLRAHLNGAEPKRREVDGRPSASVMLRYISSTGNLPFALNEVKEVVSHAVPGIQPEDVMINTSRVVLDPDAMLAGNGNDLRVPRLARFLRFSVLEEEKWWVSFNFMLYAILFFLMIRARPTTKCFGQCNVSY